MSIIRAILDANRERSYDNFGRRLIKLSEEIGEHAEAYLNASSQNNNGKNKSWDDVREEAADVLIVAVDIALTPMPYRANDGQTLEDIEVELIRRINILDGALPRTYENYERLTLLVSREYGSLTGLFLHDDQISLAQRAGFVVAMALDLALTALPDRLDKSSDEIEAELAATVDVKLTKWRNNRKSGKAPTDAE